MSDKYERIFNKRLERSLRQAKYYVKKMWNNYINELRVVADITKPVSGMPEEARDIIYSIEREGMIRVMNQVVDIDMLGTLHISNNIDEFISDMIEVFKILERGGVQPKYDLVRRYTYALPLTYLVVVLNQPIDDVPIYIPSERCIARNTVALVPACMCNFFDITLETCEAIEDSLYEILSSYDKGMFSKAYMYSYYINNALTFYEVFYAVKYLRDLLFGEKT